MLKSTTATPIARTPAGSVSQDGRALGLGLVLGVLALAWNGALIAGGAFAILELAGYAG